MNDTKQEQLKGNTIMEEGNLSYFEAVLLTAVIYTVYCLIGHFIWGMQDKRKHERLMKRKKQLEAELKNI